MLLASTCKVVYEQSFELPADATTTVLTIPVDATMLPLLTVDCYLVGGVVTASHAPVFAAGRAELAVSTKSIVLDVSLPQQTWDETPGATVSFDATGSCFFFYIVIKFGFCC
jgi:uncharacterized protein YfaS (alpha-2-macroglobulin family)